VRVDLAFAAGSVAALVAMAWGVRHLSLDGAPAEGVAPLITDPFDP
jgi:hypothetical protein